MRLFTAIDLPPHVLLPLQRLLMELRPKALINWSPPENLHVTLKFIGQWPESRLDELHDALSSLPPRDSFEVNVDEICWVPNEGYPRLLWATVSGGDRLLELAHEMEERLLALGIAKENRRFTPHVTLARIKKPVPLRPLQQKLRQTGSASFGGFRAASFELFRTDPGPNSSTYRKLREYRFEPALAAS